MWILHIQSKTIVINIIDVEVFQTLHNMSDLKFIVNELSKTPFNKNYNLISFDSLSPEDLLQVVSDVLNEVEPESDDTTKIDVHVEGLQRTAVGLLAMLRILKYRPGSDVDVTTFRQGLMQGDKQTLHPILEWVLHNFDDLKKRAYLAQYLVKLDVPNDIMCDADVGILYEQYEKLIEEFKQVHKESESIKSAGNSTAELRSDIDSIDKERDIVLKKIERMLRKIENVSNKEPLIEAAHQLRMERERKKELADQKHNESITAQQAQQRLTLLTQQLKELKQASLGATPEGLVQRIQEECNMTTYIVNNKLPREIEVRRKEMEVLTLVASETSLTRHDIDALHAKIQAVSSEVNELVERHLATTNPVVDDKLAPFRQQAAIISRKKDSIAEEFSQMKGKLNRLQKEIHDKREVVRDAMGGGEGGAGVLLRGEDFKKYVNKLRARSHLYKRRRAEAAQLKAEGGVLSRTKDILVAKQTEMQEISNEDGSELQGSLLTESPEDLLNGGQRSVEQLAALVSKLQSQVSARKMQLAPLINDLRPLRERVRETTAQHEEQKSIYERTAAALDSGSAKLEQEVRALHEECDNGESQRTLMAAKNIIMQVQLQRLTEEMRLYVEKGTTTPSLREKLVQRIAEQERLSRQLREEQARVRETQEKCKHQRQIWSNIKELLECKRKCAEEAKRNYGILHLEKGAETLVLQQ